MRRSPRLSPHLDPTLRLKQIPLDDSRWHEFVRSRSDATPFHHPVWASLLAECYGLSGFVLTQSGESGTITAGIPVLEPPRLPRRPRRLVSLPFTDALPPLVDPDAARTFTVAADAFRRDAGAARIELRGTLEGARPADVQAVTHLLALTGDPAEVARGFSKDKLRNTRVAERKGLTVRRAESERDLTEAFFDLHVATRRRLGVPTQPKRFFRLLWTRLIEPGHGFVLVVEHGTTPVGGGVFLAGNGVVVYKFSATDAAWQAQKPNDLMLWTAIRDSCLEGFSSFDFGRSDLAGAGLRAYKSSWGAVEEPLVYSTIGEGEAGESPGETGILGSVLRRSPIWVTRATGELLYRYAA